MYLTFYGKSSCFFHLMSYKIFIYLLFTHICAFSYGYKLRSYAYTIWFAHNARPFHWRFFHGGMHSWRYRSLTHCNNNMFRFEGSHRHNPPLSFSSFEREPLLLFDFPKPVSFQLVSSILCGYINFFLGWTVVYTINTTPQSNAKVKIKADDEK